MVSAGEARDHEGVTLGVKKRVSCRPEVKHETHNRTLAPNSEFENIPTITDKMVNVDGGEYWLSLGLHTEYKCHKGGCGLYRVAL